MIVRVVIMYFNDDDKARFLTVFGKHKEAIRRFEGCSYLRLMQLPEVPNAYATWSHWDNTQQLEAYRNSALFKSVWETVRPLFSQSPQAFSFEPMP